MSKFKLTKAQIQEVASLDLPEFLLAYDIVMSVMMVRLNKIMNQYQNNKPLSMRGLFILRQASITSDRLNFIFRRKSIQYSKQRKSKKGNLHDGTITNDTARIQD